MQPLIVLTQLDHHTPHDAIEAKHLAQSRAFIAAHPGNFWQRTTAAGHITASAFVVNTEHSHALMLHHAALNRWLQPGGHVDESDVEPTAAALRETLEETGVAALPVAGNATKNPAGTVLFDIDVHPIPARTKHGVSEPAHLHYDFRYLLVAPTGAVKISDESFAFRWVAIASLAEGRMDSGITRMARKILGKQT